MQSIRFSTTALTCCAILVGCGESPPTGPAASLDMLLGDIRDAAAIGTDLAQGSMPGWVVATADMPPADQCPYSGSQQRFVCPFLTVQGLTTNRHFQLLDASGAAQSTFSPGSTAAIRTVVDLSGISEAISIPPSTLRVTSHRDHTLSDLRSGSHTLNGMTTTTLEFTTESATGSETATYTQVESISNLVLSRGMGVRYPESGTITVEIGSSDVAFGDRSVTITFTSLALATMTVTINGDERGCLVDLRQPEVAPGCYASSNAR